ncbi:MAG: dihydrofolate reductase family protein [Pseudolysinimonas sp.]|uniref:dihydrofolate reductase family protein n=1 Tax=Pseudolysinimonas sp. TaxID=2680009 RepID=UPI0032662C8D
MGKVLIHSTVTLDGFMADGDGGVDWMFGFTEAAEDREVLNDVMAEIGAVLGGANKTQTIDEGEEPYGGTLKVPVFLMTHTPHAPIEKDGTTYRFVIDDIALAVREAQDAAGDKSVTLLGGSIARQCLERGLVDEIQLHVVPVLLGKGISLFSGLENPIKLERLNTAAYASVTHLRFRVVR